METRSEQLFRSFCQRAGWCAWRVPSREVKRPDFIVWHCFRRAAVEVKQIDPNPHDSEQARRLNAGLIASYGGVPGGRVRDHIKEASGQLKSLTGGRWPGLVVLYDNTGLGAYLDGYHIKVAMHGLEEIVMERTDNGFMSRTVGYRFGGKRRLTEKTGTAVSAVCRLYPDLEGLPFMDVFHNEHASTPLDPSKWNGQYVRHFRLAQGLQDERRDWVEYAEAGL